LSHARSFRVSSGPKKVFVSSVVLGVVSNLMLAKLD
jgi:hypothetical protein